MKDKAKDTEMLTQNTGARQQCVPEQTIEKQPQFPGIINKRDFDDLLAVAWSSAKDINAAEEIKSKLTQSRRVDLARLRLELFYGTSQTISYMNNDKPAPEDLKILHTAGDVKHGDAITRDIIVPTDITLHALHYVIQRAFGWQNSHLHRFSLPEWRFDKLVSGGMKDWLKLVGIVFQSPMMDEDAPFWDDDYNNGSIKNWLRKKYTAPYVSLNYGESYTACKDDTITLLKSAKESKYVVEWQKEDGTDEEVFCDCYPKLDKVGKPTLRDDYINRGKPSRKEELLFIDLPSQAIQRLFEADINSLLERLTIGEILAFGDKQLTDNEIDGKERITDNCDELLAKVQESGSLDDYYKDDTRQPVIKSITDTLHYNYDFGDDWYVKITGSWNCVDLVEAGRVTQKELDEAIISVRLNDRPVCIARDGYNVMDDIGNIFGYINFLREISDDKETDAKYELMAWARYMGWSKRKVSPRNVL